MNQKELKKKILEELGTSLKKVIYDLEQEVAQTKSLHAKVKGYLANTEAILDSFNDENSGLEATLDSAKEKESQITSLKNNADTNLQSIKTSLDSIQQHVTEIEGAYTKFVEINNKISDPNSGLEYILKNAKTLESQITSLKNEADTNLQSIKTSLNSVQQHIAEMEEAYAKFIETNNKINDEETGLEAILASSKALKSDIEATKATTETIFNQISKFKETASNYVNEINKLNESAAKTVEKIVKNHETSEDLRNRISRIFNISSQKAHANYFHDRQRFLAKTSITWLIIFFSTLVLTIGLGAYFIGPLVKKIAATNSEVISIEVFLIRLGLVSPAIFSMIYSLNQFSHERRLHEQYAFKAISMLSIESSVELLARALEKNTCINDRDNKIITFAIKTLESIYKEPVDIAKRSLIFRGGNKFLAASAEINETLGEIKDKMSGNGQLLKKVKN